MTRRAPGKWTVWQFHWLAHHKVVRALERVRDAVHGDLLDVGCGERRFAPVLRGQVRSYRGVDLPGSVAVDPTSGPDVWAMAERLPMRGRAFDTVLALAVLNYLPDPELLLQEAHRVLRPGGVLVIEFLAMGPPWPGAHDYWRYTRRGAELLLRRNGFELERCIPIGGLMGRLGLTATEALNRINRGPTRILTELPVRALYLVLQIGFELLDQVFADPDEPISNLIVARWVE